MYCIIKNLDEVFDEDTIKQIQNKIPKYLTLVKTFIVEDDYIDKYWSSEYSIHYSKTFYKDINRFTKRIHLLGGRIKDIRDIDDVDYLGYIVLRPLPIARLKISRIMLKPIKTVFELSAGEELYMATAQYKVHLYGKELTVSTFPFYQQDSNVLVCAHVDMLMVTEYMHALHNLGMPSVESFILHTLPLGGRSIPSVGLTIEQMLIILDRLGYYPSYCMPFLGLKPNDKKFDDKFEQSFDDLIERLNSFLESGLPAILAFRGHVIVIAGHTLCNDGQKSYIVYDDSGYLIDHIGETQFCCKMSVRNLKNLLKQAIQDKSNIAMINIQFEKVFNNIDAVRETVNAVFFNSENNFLTQISRLIRKQRFLVADSNEFKKFCRKNGINDLNDVAMPHYIWISELYNKDNKIIGEVILDATAHKRDFNNWIVMWVADTISFNKRYSDKNMVSCGQYPKIFSNLRII